ncbi:hypothetical protein XENOCAPTIV_011308, partial [Xenoophorus captivus]
CKQVQNPLVCNMTEAFTDPTEIYDIQVKAHLGKKTSQAAVLKGYKPIDPVVSAVLCLMVLAVIGVFALLFWTGFICLKGMPMPSVLAGAEQNPLRSDNLISVRTEEEENEEEKNEEEENEEEKNEGDMVKQDVNLLTLTFGWPEKQNEEEHFPDVPEELSAPDLPLVLPSQPAAVASSWTSDDELQSYEDCEYMNRPSADVSERLMRFDRE